MMMKRSAGWLCYPVILSAGIFLATLFPLGAQHLSDSGYVSLMRRDMHVLTADSLEGREAGTPGERMAARYVAHRFEEIGLEPFFSTGWFHHFDFPDGYMWPDEENRLLVTFPGVRFRRGISCTLTTEAFTPLLWSGNGTAAGMVVDAGYCLHGYLPPGDHPMGGAHQKKPTAVSHRPFQGKVVLARYDAPPGYSGQVYGIAELMHAKARFAKEMGATAVIFYDPDSTALRVPGNGYVGDQAPLPVIFLYNASLAKSLPGTHAEVTITHKYKRSQSKNVAAWIPNGSDQTIIIGAHLDHLGWGSFNSRYHGAPMIHPGADDNASGVTGMLALAKYLNSSDLRGKNYLFVAFGAEEKGLIGSRHFAQPEIIHPDTIFAMFNLDMIGRVDTLDPGIELLGAGSSERWQEIIPLVETQLSVKPTRGGLSGSDHFHFYDNGIPVLFFFNGIHDDYHKPSDTPDKINYAGMTKVVELAIGMLHVLDTLSTLPFQQIDDEGRGHRRNRQFSLGIIPGHGMDVVGLYVQAVTTEGPAYHAGIFRGDVIVGMGDTPIENIQQYMAALGRITEGETLPVTVIRNGETLTLTLQF